MSRRRIGLTDHAADRSALAVAAALKPLRVGLPRPDPAAAVMREQFDFLVAHAGGDCAADCPECARLDAVRELLFSPFR